MLSPIFSLGISVLAPLPSPLPCVPAPMVFFPPLDMTASVKRCIAVERTPDSPLGIVVLMVLTLLIEPTAADREVALADIGFGNMPGIIASALVPLRLHL